MNDLETFFTDLHEYVNYHVDNMFGNSVKHKAMANLNYLLTSHMGRIITGAILVTIGLLVRRHYEGKAYYDTTEMVLVQPTGFFYWVAFGMTFMGCFILGIYTLILFYNMIKNLFE